MKTNPRSLVPVTLPLVAAIAFGLVAWALPAQASKTSPGIKNPEEAATPMAYPTRFCGRHTHHHGHVYVICYGDHDHHYYCPGHD